MADNIKKEYLENQFLLDIHEASVYTKLSTSYLYKLVARKGIPHSRLGYKIIFNKVDLDKWLEEKRVEVN
jgi:excisionase family DNA binding protein